MESTEEPFIAVLLVNLTTSQLEFLFTFCETEYQRSNRDIVPGDLIRDLIDKARFVQQ